VSRPAALLFDLGNVVIDLDVGRVFIHWAQAAGTESSALISRWTLDDAYKRHETGQLSFDDYTRHLAERLEVELSLDDWRTGWNAVFRDEFAQVRERLPELAGTLPCFCFTNTNPTHHAECRRRYAATLATFEKVYVSSTIGRRKPDVESFRWVAADMGYAPEAIHFIDDSRENIDGARRVGMRATYVKDADQVRAVIDAWL
jgi:FMN phosphatase YigB (HAD superfamily)